MRTRSRGGATMNEGPVALGGSPFAETLRTVLDGTGDAPPAVAQATAGRMVRHHAAAPLPAVGGAPVAGASISASYRCPSAASQIMRSLSNPWTPPPDPYDPLGTAPRHQPDLSGLIAALHPDDAFGSGRERRTQAGLSAASLRDDTSSPSMPPLEGATENTSDTASSDDISSLSDMAAANAVLAELEDGAPNEEAQNAADAEAAVAAESPFEEVIAAVPPAPAPRARRAAAARASARISAAIHSHGMVDMDAIRADVEARELGRRDGATARAATAAASYAATVATSAGDAFGDDISDVEDDGIADEPPQPGAAVARSRARRKAGPKTTGEADPPTANLRRSTRKRSAPTANLKEDPEDVAVKPEPGAEEVGEENPSCCICLDVPEKYELSSVNGCEHHYCFGCIEKWADRENTCPQCKKRFTKIERVHKPPPNKRRKRGEGGGGAAGAGRVKNSKKVKNRDQRADVNHGNPLQGLFATMEANGTMPHAISQLIFSGLGGIGGRLMSSSRSGAAAARPSARVSGIGERRGGPEPFAGVDPFPLPHASTTPLSSMVRRLSAARQDGPAGAGAASAAFPGVLSLHLDGPSLAGSASRGPVVHLPDPWSVGDLGRASAAAAAASSSSRRPATAPHHPNFPSFRRGSASEEDGDDGDNYGSFVRRAQQGRAPQVERYGIFGGSAATRSAASAGAPTGARAFVGVGQQHQMGRTAETALEIDDDSDDDDIIEVIELPH